MKIFRFRSYFPSHPWRLELGIICEMLLYIHSMNGLEMVDIPTYAYVDMNEWMNLYFLSLCIPPSYSNFNRTVSIWHSYFSPSPGFLVFHFTDGLSHSAHITIQMRMRIRNNRMTKVFMGFAYSYINGSDLTLMYHEWESFLG